MNSLTELTLEQWRAQGRHYTLDEYFGADNQEEADRWAAARICEDLEWRAHHWGYYCIEPKPANPPLVKRLIMGALLVLAIAVDIARWVGAADLAINGWPISGIAVWAAAIPALLLIQGVAKAISPSGRSCPESAYRMSNGPV